MNVLEKVSRAIANDYGITLTLSGTQAYTDCHHINLPMVPPELLTEEMEDMLRGYCDHEIGHVLYSSAEMLTERFFRESPREVILLTGIIEDIRIENEMGKKYGGARVNMQRLSQMLLPKTDLNHPAGMLLIEGRRQVLGYKLDAPDLTSKLKEGFREERLFEKIAATKSSMDSYNLAVELLKNVSQPPRNDPESSETEENEDSGGESGTESSHDSDNNESGNDSGKSDEKPEEDEGEDEIPPKSDGGGSEKDKDEEKSKDDGNREKSENESDGKSGDDSDESKDGEGKGEGSEKSKDESESGENEWGKEKGKPGEAEPPEGNGKSEEETPKPEGENGESNGNAYATGEIGDENGFCLMSKDFEPPDKNLMQELSEIISGGIRGKYVPLSTSYDVMEEVKRSYPRYVNLAKASFTYDAMRESFPKLGALKSKVSSQFNARVAGNWMLGKEKGKINNRALATVHAGRKDVFKERYVCDDVNTAITFLVDFSGSMSCSGKIETAMKTIVMFCEILRNTKVKFEILGFTSGASLPTPSCEGGVDLRETFSRFEELVTFVFKTFDEPMNATIKDRISNWMYLRKRNNYDGESLMIAYNHIMKRKEKRRVIFVLSDGAPCPMSSSTVSGKQYLKQVTRMIEEKSPVELIGIGYLNPIVADFYKNHILINKVAELPEIMQEQLCKILRVSATK